jgi:hypothetical protein
LVVIVAKKSDIRVYFLRLLFGTQAGGFTTMTRFLEFKTAGFAALLLSIMLPPTPAAAQDGQKGQIHLQKTCAGTYTGASGSYCTVTVSDLMALPAHVARVYYDEPNPVPIDSANYLDSKIVLYISPGNWAAGRCTVDFATGLGLCTVPDGVGTLAGFSARFDVRIDFETGVTFWDGTYAFSPLPPR